MLLRRPNTKATDTAVPAAEALAPLLHQLLGPSPAVAIRFWDGSVFGQTDAATGIEVRSPLAVRHLLYAPGELGMVRAYVTGELDLDGDMFDLISLRDGGSIAETGAAGFDWRDLPGLWRAAKQLGVIGPPPPVPAQEHRLRGWRHSRRRDRQAVSSHYDVGNDFYRTLLGPTMTYSCAYWAAGETTLDEAQEAKYELVSAKLGLRPGMRLLDVGCGWGGMVLHAARHHGVRAVGVTLSAEQHRLATERVRDAGLADQIEIRRQDYRDIADGPFDAISSIGMFEHVGHARTAEYLSDLYALLKPKGRLLNHAISRPDVTSRPAISDKSFMGRYVFPDGELLEVGSLVSAMHAAGLEVRDVESLRENYARTLRVWLANLEENWHDAQRLASPAIARIWRLYLTGSAAGFEAERISIHQVLAVRPDADGTSAFPATRAWLQPAIEGRVA